MFEWFVRFGGALHQSALHRRCAQLRNTLTAAPCVVQANLSQPENGSSSDTANMPNQRRFHTLEVAEIRRLLELAIEAGLHAHDFSPRLLRAYGAMAAEFGFE